MAEIKEPKVNINLNSKPLDGSNLKKTTVKVIIEQTYKFWTWRERYFSLFFDKIPGH